MPISEAASQVIEELYRNARRKYPRQKTIMYGINDTYQIDLVEMIPYARENKNYKYILTVIDIFSKYAWALAIKTKSSKDVTQAMQSIFTLGHIPKKIHSDNGKEFYNSEFQRLMKRYNIHHYSTYTTMKAAIIERFNRTLKTKMWKRLHLNGSYKWIDLLPTLVNEYNDTIHTTIKMKPKDVNTSHEKHLLNTVYNYKSVMKSSKFNVGDHVRISKQKHLFEKGYTANWTGEIFKIIKVLYTTPITYVLKDYNDDQVVGKFYEEELQKVKYPEVYLIEKVLRRKDDKIFVKWMGFDNSHNSWIPNNYQL